MPIPADSTEHIVSVKLGDRIKKIAVRGKNFSADDAKKHIEWLQSKGKARKGEITGVEARTPTNADRPAALDAEAILYDDGKLKDAHAV